MEKIIISEKRHYPESLKHQVVKEYLAGDFGYVELMKKYDIRTRGGIIRWARQLGYAEVPLKDGYLETATPQSLPSKKTNKPQSPDALSQEQRIKELERLLEDEQLRSEMYKRMIEIAERDLNIPIRKKPGTK